MSNFGSKPISKKILDDKFLLSPSEDLVQKTLLQLSKIPQFSELFGPYKSETDGEKNTDHQRWADYQRMDWSVRQLPAINIFESQTENKQSDNAYLTGNVSIQVFWPPNFRRSALARVPATFKGILQNFFASKYVSDMLDEHYTIVRTEKVFGLNEYGKTLNWSPNVEGIVESELVPVTILEVGYRIDLRAWYREMENQCRTKDEPFKKTLDELVRIKSEIQGVDNEEADPVRVTIENNITVTNP